MQNIQYTDGFVMGPGFLHVVIFEEGFTWLGCLFANAYAELMQATAYFPNVFCFRGKF